MGQAQSEEQGAQQLSHELALRFARKCFTPLEITHFKDVFRSLADEQDGIHYWKEETLWRFLVLPDAITPGPLVYQMATYLGAFPFPSLAPSILTIEAMLKVVVIMTERYGRVLKNGKADRNKLLFRSLAVFDRRMSSAYEAPSRETLDALKEASDGATESAVASPVQSHPPIGFAIDQPANDEEEEEDDDELALAALDSLDAIEVFKHDQKVDTKIHHAQIPVDNFRRLIMLLLIIAPLDAQESLSKHAQRLTDARIDGLRRVADCILWSFTPESNAGIFYHSFNTIVPASLPFMFDGLNPLFEHFLFSKNLDLHRHRISFGSPPPRTRPVSGISSHAVLGPISLFLDESLEFGVFNHDSTGGGSFHPSQTRKTDWQDRFEIDSLEIWGCGGDEEAERQKAAWDFEEREAAARKSIKFGKDIESDRALLEMAGLVGNHNASGGSMG
ncbi:hypothetical protein P7C71_g4034, partial [Lecanoromycetidae sp. Uapishka_2]